MIDNRFLCKTKFIGIPAILAGMVGMFLLLLSACGEGNKDIVVVSFDPETTCTLRTDSLTIMISDSGITRYGIHAKVALMFEKAKEPYWYCPEGLYVERFDSLFHTEASIEADTAYNYEKQGLWKLIGHVHIANLQGSTFDTDLLYWNQKEEKIYSDQFIRIEEAERIITGVGFESNQQMTKYKIFDSKGVFPVSETTRQITDSTNVQSADSLPI